MLKKHTAETTKSFIYIIFGEPLLQASGLVCGRLYVTHHHHPPHDFVTNRPDSRVYVQNDVYVSLKLNAVYGNKRALIYEFEVKFKS